jgi:hypothetical protein
MALGRVSRAEWAWVLGWSVVILGATSLPYLVAVWLSSPANQFGGFIFGVEDGYSYLAKMRLGAHGGWLFHLFYTAEPHQGAYFYLFYQGLGKVARLTGLSLAVTYHLARLGCGLALLAAVYRFAAFFSGQIPVRRLAFWLVAAGSGLGWVVVLAGLAGPLGLPLDFYSPEPFAFHLLFGLPHLSLTLALLLEAVVALAVAWEQSRWQAAAWAGGLLVGVSLIAAFYLPIAAAVIAAALLWRVYQTGPRGRWRIEAAMAAMALVMPAPVVLYNVYVFAVNPVFQAWAAQNNILSPPPYHYGLAFGPLYALAGLAWWRGRQAAPGRNFWLVAWALVMPLLVYLPFNLQRRMTLGVQVALAVPAALAWWQLWGGRPRYRRLAAVGLAVLLGGSNLMILAGAFLAVRSMQPPLFQPGGVVAAADWLGRQATPNEVVLAAYTTANFLPTRMPARVFAGHGPETVRSEEKRALLQQFFGKSAGAFHCQFLAEHHLTYLFFGPQEQQAGPFSPEKAACLQPVYDYDSVRIFRVISP